MNDPAVKIPAKLLPTINISDVKVFASTLLRNADTSTVWHVGDVATITGSGSTPTQSFIYMGTDQTTAAATTNGDWQLLSDAVNGVTEVTIASASSALATIADGTTTPEITINTAAIADGGTALATADQIHTFVTDFGYTTNTGTVTGATSGNSDTITVSASSTSPVITAVTAAIADGGTGLATADQIFDHVTTRIAGLTSNAGTLTGIDAGSNIVVSDGATATPEVALATNVDIAGTLDVTGVATFDSNVTLGAFGITETAATLVGFSANATNFNVNANAGSTLAAPSWNINSQSYDGNTTGSNLSIGNAAFGLNSATAGSGSIGAGTGGLDISSTSTDADGIDINSSGGIEIDAVGEIRLAGNGIATAASDGAVQALVVGDNGHVMSQAFPSTAPAAYATVTGSGTVAVTSTDFNKVIFLTGTGARIVNLSDGTAAGQWVKIFNDGAGTTDTIINGTIVGGNLTIDDSTANFEMIWDGSIWRILTA